MHVGPSRCKLEAFVRTGHTTHLTSFAHVPFRCAAVVWMQVYSSSSILIWPHFFGPDLPEQVHHRPLLSRKSHDDSDSVATEKQDTLMYPFLAQNQEARVGLTNLELGLSWSQLTHGYNLLLQMCFPAQMLSLKLVHCGPSKPPNGDVFSGPACAVW